MAEKYGLEPQKISEKKLDDMIDMIKKMPLSSKTELKSLYVYIVIKIEDIKKYKKKFIVSDDEFKNDNREKYCDEIDNLIEDVDRLKYLMELKKDKINLIIDNIICIN